MEKRDGLSRRKILFTGALTLAGMKVAGFFRPEQALAKTKKDTALSVEERFAQMEEKIASQDHEIMRLQAINEIQNLMGLYEAIHTGDYIQRTWEFYARHTPNTWMDISNWGVFVGIDSIKRAWTQGQDGVVGEPNPEHVKQMAESGGGAKGMPKMKIIAEHHLTTPVIQVAGDGQTAKAIWFSPGVEVNQWAFGKYAIDFVKEDGVWRIWHLKWFRTFLTPFGTSWMESEDPAPLGERNPDKPVVYHKPFNSDAWTGDPIPPAPKPYDTWTEAEEGWQYRAEENFSWFFNE